MAVNFTSLALKALLLPAILLVSPPQSSVRKTAEPPVLFEHDETLQTETDALLPLFDNMLRVPVYLADELISKEGADAERGTAYTHCYPRQFPTIFVKKTFYQKANRIQRVNALKHELTHAWLCRQRMMSVGHGEAFRRKFESVGGFGN